MELLNRAIVAVHDAGLSELLYQAWIIVVYLVVAVFCFFWRRHYGYDWLRALFIPLVLLLGLNFLILLLGWAFTGFTQFGNKNIVIGYPFVPLLTMALARLMRDDWRRMMDFMTPAFPLTQVVAKISCCFAGCCFGFPMEHGLWNPVFGMTLFPVQLLESLVALIVTCLCVLLARRTNYRADGRMYPAFLILFGSTRFFLEFLRVNIKVFWLVSELALWALVMVIAGAVWLARKKGNRRAAR